MIWALAPTSLYPNVANGYYELDTDTAASQNPGHCKMPQCCPIFTQV